MYLMQGGYAGASWGLRAASLVCPSKPLGFRPLLPGALRAAGLCVYPYRAEEEGGSVSTLSRGKQTRNLGVPLSTATGPACGLRSAVFPSFRLGGFFCLPLRPPALGNSASSIPELQSAPACNRQSVRFKMVKSSAYHRRGRASPTGQTQKAHIGPKRLSAEYVTPGAVLVKQRRYIAWGFESKRRARHKKMYPGENVGVAKDSSLVALVHGRVKYTHETSRDVMLCNVLPEPREELLREDLWRYRTEHVASKEENRSVCHLRMKATRVFPKKPVNPPTKPLPRPKWLSRFDVWQNPTLPDAPPLCEDR